MLKITGLLYKPVFSKNNSSKSASSKNNNNRPAFKKNNGNNKVNRYGISVNGMKYAKKLGKLSKLRKSKSEKISKFQNLVKSGKMLLKSGNSINFDIIKVRPKILNF